MSLSWAMGKLEEILHSVPAVSSNCLTLLTPASVSGSLAYLASAGVRRKRLLDARSEGRLHYCMSMNLNS